MKNQRFSPNHKNLKKPQEPKDTKNQRKLGNRIVTLKPWSGKTKKKFKKEFEFAESMEDVDLKKIIEILVYDQIEEDYQLTEMELQFLLAELKETSIGNEIDCDSECPSCSAVNKISTSTKDSITFEMDTMPAEFNEWKFKNVTRAEFKKLKKEITESENFDGLSTEADIELACKISKNKKTPVEMIEILDETPLKELTEMMDEYVKHLAFFDIKISKKCIGCQDENLFDVDIITGIFETMAK